MIKYLKDVSELRVELERYPDKLQYYAKYSSFIGPIESIDFITKLISQSYDSPIFDYRLQN